MEEQQKIENEQHPEIEDEIKEEKLPTFEEFLRGRR